jgi:GR25 family glycosyltransferase involved in LPS biosynthesis
MLNATYEVFHIDLGNEARNICAQNIVETMGHLPRLNSPTVYLDTKDKVEEFKAANPEFKINTVENYAQPGETFPPSAGVVGVWASNYLAYKNFLNTDKDLLFLFEDDVLLSKNFELVTAGYLRELPADWDFFSLFVPDDSLFAYTKEHDIGKNYICKSYQQWSCAGYVVSRNGAMRAIQNIESQGITAPIDWYIFNFRMKPEVNKIVFNTYTVKPNAYRPVRFNMSAAPYSQIHRGSTELI